MTNQPATQTSLPGGFKAALRAMFKRRTRQTTTPASVQSSTITVKVVEDTHLFDSDDGSTLWCAGYTPVAEDGTFMPIAEHRVSDPRCTFSNVAGVSHRAEALQEKCFSPGAKIMLRPEPTNAYDSNAVAVWDDSGTVQVGYVPATLSERVAESFRNGNPLSGVVISEFRLNSKHGKRVGLHVLLVPLGELHLSISAAKGEDEE
jgi:HIRAN domain